MALELPTISWNSPRLKILWASDWWDGIISGIATLDGRRIYFNCISEETNGDRKFAFYDVPAEVWQEIDERHRDFQQHVGTHFDYVEMENGMIRRTGDIRPRSEHRKFYDKWKNRKIAMNEEWKIMIAESLAEE